MQVQRLDLGRDGQVIAIERGPSPQFDERPTAIDTRHALSQPRDQLSMQWMQARSPHYVAAVASVSRVPGEALPAHALSPADQAMFDKIRQGAPMHVGDDVVAHAMLAAKQNGISDASRIGRTMMAGDTLWVAGTTPGMRASVDVTAPAPTLVQTSDNARQFNEQRQLDVQRTQDEPARAQRMA